jgi:hypothetical protein
MEQQTQQYQMIVTMEGWCGWADRLKHLLFGNVVVMVQDSPCTEFYQDLMKPHVHYMPISCDLSDLISQIGQLQRDTENAESIATEALHFAHHYLNERAIQGYFDLVMAHYISLFGQMDLEDGGRQ